MIEYLLIVENENDTAKFTELYLRYRNDMYWAAMKVLRNPDDAEDVVHQVFLELTQNMDKITSVDSIKTKSYLFICVEHRAIDLIRRNARTKDKECELTEAHGITIDSTGMTELEAAIAALPAECRELVLLRYRFGYTAHELAEIFNIHPRTVNKRLTKAKNLLRIALEGGIET